MKTPSQSPLQLAAPFVCAGVLIAAIILGGTSAHRPLGTTEYRARVKAAIEAIPYKIGPAVGIDSEPTPAAIQLLSPNKILERRYVDPTTGQAFNLMIVHCGDVRDMDGHYPPVCYKAHGWTMTDSKPAIVEMCGEKAGGITYYFTRTDELFAHGMSILDFFVIPEEGKTIFADMNAMKQASRSSELGGLGVAQIQILVGDDCSPKWRDDMVRETLKAIEPAVRSIAQGINK